MLLLALTLLQQQPLERRILEAEHSRSEDVSVLVGALQSPDVRIQRLAVRALGRLERPGLAPAVGTMLHATDPAVRREAVNAMGQLKAPFDMGALLGAERDTTVRAVIYATIGRLPVVSGISEAMLLAGLRDPVPSVRTGAARGLENLFRLNGRTLRPDSLTLPALHAALAANPGAGIREYLLLTMNALGDRDSVAYTTALHDADPQVRRLALMGWRPRADDPPFSGRPEAARAAMDDPSPIVRYEALRILATCELALAAIADSSEHVALAAVDLLGTKRCDPAVTLDLVQHASDWRRQAHALVALARSAPEALRARLPGFAAHPNWLLRVYAANAARIIKDEPTLARLAADPDPNVAIAAMSTPVEAIRALSSPHNGLLFAAAQRLKGKPELAAAIPQITATLLRLSQTGRATYRDAKVELLERVREAGTASQVAALRPLLSDVDPVVAMNTAAIITQKSGVRTVAVTTAYHYAPLPPDSYLQGLAGATATFTMKGIGSFTMALLMDEAPASAGIFAQNAESGLFNGLTFHRVVSNFLIQGGSPGADEYDGATTFFMPEEVGLTWHDRGTIGTSTRGHDTGDGQLYVNTVDNYRLDNTYTLYGRVTSGMDVVDRIMEGDIITSVTIARRPR